MELDDLQIVQNIKNRDISTFEYLIEKYSKQMYYLAYNILHISCTKEDIEECVADVFAKVWLKIEEYNPDKGNFKTWLFMLTKYMALKYKRSILKEQTINIDDLFIEDKENIEKKLILRQEQEKIISIIDNFNKIDKELFLRRYFYGESTDALMHSLNLTRPAIDNRLLRCRKTIKEAFYNE